MRVEILVVGLVLALAGVVRAELCGDCKGKVYTKDIGTCTVCKDGVTTSGQFKLCMACSSKLGECEHCRMPLKAATQPTTRGAAKEIDPRNDGKYVEGAWEYRFTVTLKGTRSEGYTGELLYGGKAVPEPTAMHDFYQTPWGPIYWMGNPVESFGRHGWMPKHWMAGQAGKELAAPVADVSKPGVYKDGAWEYRLLVTGEGTKSQGVVGELSYKGKAVEEPGIGDYHVTPWGAIQWVGNPILAWEPHGWMLRKGPGGVVGKELKVP